MGIGSLQFRLHPEATPSRKPQYSIVIDGTELVTSSVLQDDIEYLLAHCEGLSVPGKRLDVLFTQASPFSVSVQNRDGALLLRISDNFDGGVLEEPVDFPVLRAAICGFVEELVARPGMDPAARSGLLEALGRFRAWPGPVLRN